MLHLRADLACVKIFSLIGDKDEIKSSDTRNRMG